MQPFVLYNSEQRKVEFVPRKEGHIDMYVCGMTVYDYVISGMLELWLHLTTLFVSYVVKAECRTFATLPILTTKSSNANENGETIQQLTTRFIDAMNEDAANLGCAAPDEAPKATEYIDQMQNMIGNLVNKGAAYPAANGDVYFEVTKFEKYGRLLWP